MNATQNPTTDPLEHIREIGRIQGERIFSMIADQVFAEGLFDAGGYQVWLDIFAEAAVRLHRLHDDGTKITTAVWIETLKEVSQEVDR